MEIARRQIPLGMLASILTSCAGQSGGSVTVTPPSFDQVKAFLTALAADLPTLLADLVIAQEITPAQGAIAREQAQEIQQILTELDSAKSTTELVNQIGIALARILSLVPQAAPFVPLLLTAQALIAAYLSQTALTAPNGVSVPAPPPPAPDAMQALHAQTRRMRR